MKYHGTVFDVTGQFPSLPVSRSGYALRDLHLNVVEPNRVLDVVHGMKVGLWSLKTIMVERHLLLAPCLGFARSPEEQEGRVSLLFVMFLG